MILNWHWHWYWARTIDGPLISLCWSLILDCFVRCSSTNFVHSPQSVQTHCVTAGRETSLLKVRDDWNRIFLALPMTGSSSFLIIKLKGSLVLLGGWMPALHRWWRVFSLTNGAWDAPPHNSKRAARKGKNNNDNLTWQLNYENSRLPGFHAVFSFLFLWVDPTVLHCRRTLHPGDWDHCCSRLGRWSGFFRLHGWAVWGVGSRR